MVETSKEIIINKSRVEYVRRLSVYESVRGVFKLVPYVEVGFFSGQVLIEKEEEVIFEE